MITLQFTSGEDIDTFNNDIDRICTSKNIIAVSTSVIASTLFVTLTEAEDSPDPDTILVQPMVVPFGSRQLANLSHIVNDFANKVRKTGSEGSPRDPIDVRIIPRQDSPDSGYVILLVCIGVLDVEGDPS